MHRRHLDVSQRAMVAAKIATLQNGQHASETSEAVTQPQAAKLLNVSPDSVGFAKKTIDNGAPELVTAVERGEVAVSTAAVVAELPKPEQVELVAKGEREILAKAKEIRAAKTLERRTERVERIAESIHEPTPLTELSTRYPVIYADPPWQYDFAKDSADEIENQYPTMALDDICAMPVADIATRDCILFLWATSPKLTEAMRVIDSWGFTYRTCAVWDKEWIGPGYYFRQRHELLLVATRGELPVPEPSNRPDSVYSERRTEHSRKPEAYRAMIEQMYPELPRIELFCRTPREGWSVWGNQI